MIRALFHATTLPNASAPYNVLHLKIYYPAAPTNSDAERMSGVIPADKTSAPMPVVIFFNGINVGIESYHWLAVKLAEANIITVMYTHVAETLPGVIGLTPAIDLSKVKPDTYGSGATCPAIQPILDSLAQLNSDEKSPLCGAMDLNHIILGGHSAGGTVALQNAQFFAQVKAVFAYAGHTMASTMLGFEAGTVLKVGDKSMMLMRGDKDGVIAASRVRYGMTEQSQDPVEKTFDEACQPSVGEEALDVLLQGANHFAIAHPLDET
ncbi:MAG TPA: hypothetical protein PLV64_21995, partial [Anaerolineales bacterium]|nr:hypothetical protein [Anaerolineales bacterium]